MKYLILLVLTVNAWNAVAEESISETELTQQERQELKQRIQQFYKNPSAQQMNVHLPKYSVATKQQAKPNPELVSKKPLGQSPLQQSAQLKSTQKFRDQECKQFLDKKFPQLKCSSPDGRATAEANDQVENLTKGWMDDVSANLNDIPAKGKTKLPIWSDDYWRIKYGITSYRYQTEGDFGTYKEAIKSYEQPSEFEKLLKKLDPSELSKEIAKWSPAEKYDITVGDSAFSLTNEQKEEGRSSIGEDGDVESWMGICHGWAAAAIVVPQPKSTVKVKGIDGVTVTWYPSEIRSMASLAWANGSAGSNFIGGRCDSKDVRTDNATGRILQQGCFDNNPATFHLALGNMVGRKKLSFVMDKTFDYEVWNQPIHSYEFEYFNVTDTDKTSKDWDKVAVDYSDFKKEDRFKKFRGAGLEKIVGVSATVVYLAETAPESGSTPAPNNLMRVTYTYDLELHKEGRGHIAKGGEWHENTHPDFLWVPNKGTVASHDSDSRDFEFALRKAPSEDLTNAAKSGSRSGYPLCKVLEKLVEKSSGDDSYKCE